MRDGILQRAVTSRFHNLKEEIKKVFEFKKYSLNTTYQSPLQREESFLPVTAGQARADPNPHLYPRLITSSKISLATSSSGNSDPAITDPAIMPRYDIPQIQRYGNVEERIIILYGVRIQG